MVFVCAISLAQAPKYSGEDIQHLLNRIVSWSAEPNQLNTPGIKAELRELERHEQDGHLAVSYVVNVTGAPRNQTYAVFEFPLASQEPKMLLPAVHIAKDGLVCLNAAPDCAGPVQLSTIPTKGEPYLGALISQDSQYRVVTFVVPNPVIGIDQGCSLEVIRLTPKFDVALIRGKGFKQNEIVKITTDFAGEAVDATTAVNAKGRFDTILTPFVKNVQTGVATSNFKGSACAPAISFKWGE
jgi:hypothetical protein